MKSIAVFSLLFFISPTIVLANPFCSAILEQGIFDRDDSLDTKNGFILAKRVHCASSVSNTERASEGSASIGFKGFEFGGSGGSSKAQSNSSEFCRMSYDAYKTSQQFKYAVKNINQGIVSAWGTCMSAAPTQTIHRIIPSSDPLQFAYEIFFRPKANVPTKEVKIRNWEISKNGDCKTKPNKSDSVDFSGKTYIMYKKIKR